MSTKKAKAKTRKPAMRSRAGQVAFKADPSTRAGRIAMLKVGESEAVATILNPNVMTKAHVEAAVKGHRGVMSKAAAMAHGRTKRHFVVDIARALTHGGDICVTCAVTRIK